MKEKELYIKIIEKFGEANQIERLIEELSELILSLQKFKRYKNDISKIKDVCSELSDVEILLSQMRLIFPENIINNEKIVKLKRLKEQYLINGDN